MEPPPRARTPAAALVLLAPALVFVSANLLKYSFGAPFAHDLLEPFLDPDPAVLAAARDLLVLLGPVAALALSVAAIVRLGVRQEGGAVHATLTVQLTWPHLAVAALSLAILAAMGAYLVAENLPCLAGVRAHC